MTARHNPLDHKGLICESYRIDGITAAECRSIFLDWVLSLPDDQNIQHAAAHFLTLYEADHPDHPMTEVLRQGLLPRHAPRRRGGWKSRPRD
ncbi:MAG: hypothetical protein Q4P24_08335 [Rhodobacterales bacterium]|nr:hypothetical protein [Rhodobacterales bacterium]